jgi:hypothetical protein
MNTSGHMAGFKIFNQDRECTEEDILKLKTDVFLEKNILCTSTAIPLSMLILFLSTDSNVNISLKNTESSSMIGSSRSSQSPWS